MVHPFVVHSYVTSNVNLSTAFGFVSSLKSSLCQAASLNHFLELMLGALVGFLRIATANIAALWQSWCGLVIWQLSIPSGHVTSL